MREEVLQKIFLDLKKSYNALYRESCLEILVAYRFGPRTKCLLRKYWARKTMVSWVGRYYGALFTGSKGVSLQ